MRSSQYCVTNLLIKIGNFQLRGRNQSCVFDGWRKVLHTIDNNNDMKDNDNVFKDCNQGDMLVLNNVVSTQFFTKVLIRYNAASLVKALEKRDIGRLFTYVGIISIIQNRGYFFLYKKKFYAIKIGEIVADQLFENFCELMDYKFAANMENILNDISDNKQE